MTQPEDFEPEDMDVAGQVAYEDTGRPWAARAIRHPSHAQQDRRVS